MVREVKQKEAKQAPEAVDTGRRKQGDRSNKEEGTENTAPATRQRKDPSEKTGYQVMNDKYVPAKTAKGGKSYHSGDETAKMLEGKTLDEVFALAAKKTGIEEKELRSKYEHLANDGLRRMALGNRIRAAVKKEAAEKAA